jgi:hypothetical protein
MVDANLAADPLAKLVRELLDWVDQAQDHEGTIVFYGD